MINVHGWPTANCRKVFFALEELGLDYQITWVDIGAAGQYATEFVRLAPNSRVPVIEDSAPLLGEHLVLAESGAILMYLAEKSGRLIPERKRYQTWQWVMWQMSGLGPMAGQASHFRNYATEKIPYAIDRYVREVRRLYQVLDTHLSDREYVTGDFSIADIAIFPWVVSHAKHGQALEDFPAITSWFSRVGARPAASRALSLGAHLQRQKLSEQTHPILFGSQSIRKPLIGIKEG